MQPCSCYEIDEQTVYVFRQQNHNALQEIYLQYTLRSIHMVRA